MTTQDKVDQTTQEKTQKILVSDQKTPLDEAALKNFILRREKDRYGPEYPSPLNIDP